MIQFMKSIGVVWWYAIAMVFYFAGEVASKYWAIKQTPLIGLSAAAIYLCGTFCWLSIMAQKNQLALMSGIWQVLGTMTSMSIGLFLFHEHFTKLQWSGAALLIIGLILLIK
jgi:multidrug transporter EmrE-like cation transporter